MDSIKDYINKNFSQKRKDHTYGVVDTAIKLCKIYGCDVDQAETAALFHDYYRGKDKETLNSLILKYNLDSKYLDNPNLSHGKLAAITMEKEYDIKDKNILNAVSYHTTGRKDMSLLEKIVFIADATEPGRDYPGVENLRKLSKENINEACLQSINSTIEFVQSKGEYLDLDTISARDWLLKERKNNMESRDIAILAAKALDNKKGIDIMAFDIGSVSSFAESLVIVSGNSERQVGAFVDEVEDELAKVGVLPKSIEGKKESGWILMDYGDVIINVLTVDMREKYKIEKVWIDCNTINWEEEDVR